MARQTLIVTGAGGFIGRATAESLVLENRRVVACVSPRSTTTLSRRVSVCRMRLPSLQFDELISSERPQWLIHCAGSASVPASIDDPVQDWWANVVVTDRIYTSLAKYSPETKVIFLSSAAVYGQPLAMPITEDTPIAPISPYGRHKRACELIGTEFEKQYGIRSTCLRVFSVYGTGLQKQVLWDIYRKAKAASTIQLDGTGRETRDFIHVNDIADLISGIVSGRCIPPGVLNVASGKSIEIAHLAQAFLGLLGMEREVCFSGKSRSGIPGEWTVDSRAYLGLPGVRPTELHAGLKAYANWLIHRDGEGDANRLLVAAG